MNATEQLLAYQVVTVVYAVAVTAMIVISESFHYSQSFHPYERRTCLFRIYLSVMIFTVLMICLYGSGAMSQLF